MEGAWRVMAAVRVHARLMASAIVLVGLAGTGCGGPADGAVVAENPARTFAPVVNLASNEQFRPTDVGWFLARSAFGLAEDEGCPDRKIAVGRRLKEQRNPITDWLFPTGLGVGPAYWRQSYLDAGCKLYREEYRYYANQLTRPHERGPDRAVRLRPGEGYYLDLMDWARAGPPTVRESGQAVVRHATVWHESQPAEIDGEAGISLTYWMLYGMNAPNGADGRPVGAMTHEGDWERVEVLLREGDGDDEWVPEAVRLSDPAGRWRELPWSAVRREPSGPGGKRTHPVVYAAHGSHGLYVRPGRHARDFPLDDMPAVQAVDVVPRPCRDCPRWETWRHLSPVRKQDWYGFGGSWGEPGATDLTTGPLGPHGKWATGPVS